MTLTTLEIIINIIAIMIIGIITGWYLHKKYALVHPRKLEYVYVLAERAKVVPFTIEEFDILARAYRASSEQRAELVEKLMNPPPLPK